MSPVLQTVWSYLVSLQSSVVSRCLHSSLSPSSHPSPFISLSFLFPFLFLLCLVFFVGPSPVLLHSFSILIFSTYSVFCPFSLGFLISCVLTTSPHLPSSDPSGPETLSFSAHHTFPPPKVLTPQHTALSAAVHTLGLWRCLIAKVCLSP